MMYYVNISKNEFSLELHQRSHPQRKPSAVMFFLLQKKIKVYRRTSNTTRIILPQFQFFMERQDLFGCRLVSMKSASEEWDILCAITFDNTPFRRGLFMDCHKEE